jgi:hypothetical protein
LLNRLLVLYHLSSDAGFEFGTQAPSFSFTHLVLFRVGRPQKLALFINKALAPFPGTTSYPQKEKRTKKLFPLNSIKRKIIPHRNYLSNCCTRSKN